MKDCGSIPEIFLKMRKLKKRNYGHYRNTICQIK